MRDRSRIVQTLCTVTFLSVLSVLAGCIYHTAESQLTPQEQAEFRAHRKQMSPGQVRVYLAKPTPDARAAYLGEIGSAQRFAMLDHVDRESVLAGEIRRGMSAEALRFLWGDPYHIDGYGGHYESWSYIGSMIDLTNKTNNAMSHADYGLTLVQVYLVDGRVTRWLEVDGPYKS